MNTTVIPLDPDDERRRQAAYRRLGSSEPQCIVCGEDDWRCLELHHVAGRAYDELGVILCRNCHRKQSDPSSNAANPTDPPMLERAGRFLLGLYALFAELLSRLRVFGQQLLEAATVSPWPYGWVGAPGIGR